LPVAARNTGMLDGGLETFIKVMNPTLPHKSLANNPSKRFSSLLPWTWSVVFRPIAFASRE